MTLVQLSIFSQVVRQCVDNAIFPLSMWTNWNSCLGGGNIKLQLNLESTQSQNRNVSFSVLVYEPLFLYIDNSGVSLICSGFLTVPKPFVADYSLCPSALLPMLALFHILSPQASYSWSPPQCPGQGYIYILHLPILGL